MTVETNRQLSRRTVYMSIDCLAQIALTHLNTLGVHLIVFFRFRPI